MGVKSLWSLLTPVGRPVMLETMEGKIMAIDSSIWIYQFQATMRAKDGRALVNAHVLGFLRRICKLLFYGIKPVFVFDGGAPALKRETLNERRKKKSGAAASHVKLAEKLLAAQMRREALKYATKGSSAKGKGKVPTGPVVLDENTVYLEDIDPTLPVTPAKKQPKAKDPGSSSKKNKFYDHDPYRLPDINMQERVANVTSSVAPDPRLATEEELRTFIESMRPEDFDVTSPAFRELPTEVQYEIVGDLRLKSRQTSYTRLQQMLRSARTPLDFSKQQIKNLQQRNTLTQQLLTTTDSIGKAHISIPVRIASERNKEYVLIKNDGAAGGWILGIRDEGTKQKPIVIDHENDKEDVNATDEEDDMEEVTIPDSVDADPDLRKYQRRMALSAIASRYTPKKLAPLTTRPQQKPSQVPLFELDDEDDEDWEPAPDVWEEDEDLAFAVQQSFDQAKSTSTTDFAAPASPIVVGIETLPIASSSKVSNVDATTWRDVTAPNRLETALTIANAERSRDIVVGATRIGTDRHPLLSARSEHSPSSPSQNKGRASDSSGHSPPVSTLSFGKPSLLILERTSSAEDTASEKPSFISHLNSSTSGSIHTTHNEQIAQSPSLIPVAADTLSGTFTVPGDASPQPTLEPIEVDADSASDDEDLEEITPLQPQPGNSTLVEPVSSHHEHMNPLYSQPVNPKSTHIVEIVSSHHEDMENINPLHYQFATPASTPTIKRSASDEIDKVMPLSQPAIPASTRTVVSDDEDMEEVWPVTVSPVGPTRGVPEAPLFLSDNTTAADPYDGKSTSPGNELARSPSPDEIPQDRDSRAPSPHVEEDWDAAQEMNPVAEEGEFARFMSQVKGRDIDDVRREIDNEIEALDQQRKNAMRDSEDVTQQMITQIMMMLRLFGIPYITAPMEAEAQCAALVALKLVDGIITDDSDVFLFGGQRVFKNMFNQSKTVECFLLSDLNRELGLDQGTLIRLAYLLGSDYVDGLPGVGPVVAMELLKEFSGEDGLHKFKDWWLKVQSGKDKDDDTQSAFRKRFKKKFKDLYLPPEWPNAAVRDAYYHPTVDDSEEPFKWGLPDLDALRKFLHEELSWGQSKVDDLLLPIIQKMGKRGQTTALNRQGNLNEFFDVSAGSGTYAPRKRQAYASKRLQQVVSDFRKQRKGTSSSPSPASRVASGDEDEAEAEAREDAPPKKKARTSRARKNKETSDSSGRRKRPAKRGERAARGKTQALEGKAAAPSGEDDYGTGAEGGKDADTPPPLAVNLRPRPKPKYRDAAVNGAE